MDWWATSRARRHFGAGAGRRKPVSAAHVLPQRAVMHGGSPWRGDQPASEQNPDVQDLRTRVREMQQMVRTDGELHAHVGLLVDTACEAIPIVVEREGIPEGKRALHAAIAEDCRRAMGWEGRPCMLRGQTWEDVCRELAAAPAFGFALGVWSTYGDPSPREGGDGVDGRPWLDSVAFPDRGSVWRWHRCSDTGRVDGWVQYPESGQPRPDADAISLGRSVLVRYRPEGDDPEGTPILRSLRHAWLQKRQALESMGIAVGKMAVPHVAVEVDRREMQAQGWADSIIERKIADAETQAANFNAKGGGYLRNEPGIRFVFMDAKYDPGGMIRVVDWSNAEYAQAFRAGQVRSSLVYPTPTAADEVQTDAHKNFVSGVMDLVMDSVSVQMLTPLMVSRYGPDARRLMPIVTHKGLRPHPLANALPLVGGLLAAGALRGSVELGDTINDIFRLPSGAGSDEALAEAMRRQANTPDALAAQVVPGPGRGHLNEAPRPEQRDDTADMGNTEPEDWVPAKVAAQRFGASASSLKTLHSKGEIRRITLNGRHKYLISDIEKALGLRDLEGGE